MSEIPSEARNSTDRRFAALYAASVHPCVAASPAALALVRFSPRRRIRSRRPIISATEIFAASKLTLRILTTTSKIEKVPQVQNARRLPASHRHDGSLSSWSENGQEMCLRLL